MPLLDRNHLSPTGQRLSPPQVVAPTSIASVRPSSPLSASQLNADVAAYTAELVELRRMVLLKIMGETRGD